MDGLRIILIAGLCTFAMSAMAMAQKQERRYTLLEREIEYLMAIWPGDYDNREQVEFDLHVGKRLQEEGAHARVHSQIRRVDLPAFGDYVLYVEEYRDNDPEIVYRQRLYELVADESEKAIRIRQHSFMDGKKWLGAHNNPDLFAKLARNDTTMLSGCDLMLRRNVDAITGGTKTKACVVGDGENQRYSDQQVRVTETGYWFRDPIVSTDVSWHQLERARWFQCMIDFPRDDGGAANNTVGYVRIHDQGGTYPFTYLDGRDMVLTVRNTWSYGMQRETLVIVVQESDEAGPTLVYGWGEPGSDRLGVNPGWIRLQCDLDTPENRRFQHWLRPGS